MRMDTIIALAIFLGLILLLTQCKCIGSRHCCYKIKNNCEKRHRTCLKTYLNRDIGDSKDTYSECKYTYLNCLNAFNECEEIETKIKEKENESKKCSVTDSDRSFSDNCPD